MPKTLRALGVRNRLIPAISLGIALALISFTAGPWTAAFAATTPIGLNSLSEFGMNSNHIQIVDTAANHGFTTNWTISGASIMDPAIIHGVLYGDTINMPYGAIAINPTNGHTLWFHPFANQMMNSPIYQDGTVYFGLGNNRFPSVPVVSHPDIRGTGVNQVVALNATTGVTEWVYHTAGEDMPTFVLYDQGLYVANGADQVLDLSPKTGQVQQSLAIPSYVSMSSPTVVDHTMYFGGAFPYSMYAVNLKTMKVAWSTPTRAVGGLDDDSPVANLKEVYIQAVYDDNGNSTSVLLAFNDQTGKMVWSRTVGEGIRPFSGPLYESGVPLLENGIIYTGTSVSDAVYAVRANTGQVLWSNSLNGKGVAQAPVLVDHRLLVGDAGGTVFVLNPTSGHVLHSVHFPGGRFMPGVPFVDGNTIFFGTQTGMFFARPLSQLLGGQ